MLLLLLLLSIFKLLLMLLLLLLLLITAELLCSTTTCVKQIHIRIIILIHYFTHAQTDDPICNQGGSMLLDLVACCKTREKGQGPVYITKNKLQHSSVSD